MPIKAEAAATSDTTIAGRVLGWFDQHGRHDLPWQHPRTPYRVWLSEIMLQQTQVATVISYFGRFITALPDLPALAGADDDRVMALWAGLGYYSRARNLHKAARLCVDHHAGELPRDFDELLALPGIGRSTAAAILAQSYGLRHAILDGNVKRVLARYHGVGGWPGQSQVARELWHYAEQHTPSERVADYTQAIMDLGATVCSRARPACDRCPLSAGCVALAEQRTGELPARRPTRKLPVRETWVLFQINDAGQLMLEKRPPSGVWGGLWALPMSERLPGTAADLQAPPLRHSFTHFKLILKPVQAHAATVGDRPTRWVSASDVAELGLPKPIKQLVDQHFRKQLLWQEPSTA